LATAHRLVGELVEWGALTRQASGQYVVGRRMWDLGLLAPDRNDLRQVASPFLHDLYAATLATTALAVRDGTQALNIDRLSGRASVPIGSDVGSRVPLYATGVGKVLLAHAPLTVQAEVLSNLKRLTPYTTVSRRAAKRCTSGRARSLCRYGRQAGRSSRRSAWSFPT
jgi:DNA-binding IclR family transcriptional regulator